jgi:hypothetical protein
MMALVRPSDRRLSVKLVPTFADRGGVAWSVWRIPTAVITIFLDRKRKPIGNKCSVVKKVNALKGA